VLANKWLSGLSKPVVQFILLGTIAYLVFPPANEIDQAPQPVSLGAAQINALKASWSAATGRMPSAEELENLIARETDEEILFQEALRLGVHLYDPVIRQRLLLNIRFLQPEDERDDDRLFEEAIDLSLHLNDLVIRRRLIQVMELSIEGDVRFRPVDPARLNAEYASRSDEFVEPEKIRLSHIYLSRDRRRSSLVTDAEALLAELRAGQTEPGDITTLGDAFLGGQRLPLQSARELSGQFGTAFGESVMRCEPHVWCGPVESAYGLHLVYVEQRIDARPLAVDDPNVVRRLTADINRLKAEQLMADALTELRKKYGVQRS